MRSLGRDQSQDHELVLGDIFERFERAGAIIVVFKQEALRSHLAEQLPADRFITALGQPPAALISASDVQAKCYSGKAIYDGIVQLDAKTQPLVQAPALPFVKASRLGVEQKTIVGRV